VLNITGGSSALLDPPVLMTSGGSSGPLGPPVPNAALFYKL